MSPRIVAGMVVSIALGATAAVAQSLPTAVPPVLNRVVRSGWMRLQVDRGRFRLMVASVGQVKPPQAAGAWPETLTLSTRGGHGALDYDLKLPDQWLQIRGDGSGELVVIRKPQGESQVTPLEFSQRPGEPLRLAVGEGPDQHVLTAGTFWHLLLSRPTETEELLPILRWMAADGILAPSAVELEDSLVRLAQQRQWLRREQWTQWVAQLADERFAVREAADRELRSAGAAVAPFLEEIDFRRLDAEQQYRLRRILHWLEREIDPSSAQHVATTLLGDKEVWLILMQQEQEGVRRAAAEQLGLLLGSPARFDPAADPAARQQQLDALRRAIASP